MAIELQLLIYAGVLTLIQALIPLLIALPAVGLPALASNREDDQTIKLDFAL